MTNGPYIVDETCLVFAKNIEKENERLRTENEKLRKLVNEKLRKLVKDAYYEGYRDRDSLGDAGTDDPEDRCAWRLSAAAAALGETDE